MSASTSTDGPQYAGRLLYRCSYFHRYSHGSFHPSASSPLCVIQKQSRPNPTEKMIPPAQSILLSRTTFLGPEGMTIDPMRTGTRAVPPKTAKQYCHPRLSFSGHSLAHNQRTLVHTGVGCDPDRVRLTHPYLPTMHRRSVQVQHLLDTPMPSPRKPYSDPVPP